jgi:hypothetical protein
MVFPACTDHKDDTKALYLDLYSGNMRLAYCFSFLDNKIKSACPTLHVWIFSPSANDKSTTYPCKEMALVPFVVVRTPNQTAYYNLEAIQLIGCSLSQRTAVGSRAIHILLRLRGADFGFMVLLYLSTTLNNIYAEGWWKEQLDAQTIMADLTMETQMPVSYITWCLDQLRQTFLACGQSFVAAGILDFAAQLCFEETDT